MTAIMRNTNSLSKKYKFRRHPGPASLRAPIRDPAHMPKREAFCSLFLRSIPAKGYAF
jgi:hypothetical protein